MKLTKGLIYAIAGGIGFIGLMIFIVSYAETNKPEPKRYPVIRLSCKTGYDYIRDLEVAGGGVLTIPVMATGCKTEKVLLPRDYMLRTSAPVLVWHSYESAPDDTEPFTFKPESVTIPKHFATAVRFGNDGTINGGKEVTFTVVPR